MHLIPDHTGGSDLVLYPNSVQVLFRAKTGSLKSVWRFVDFAEFCVTFATVNKQVTPDSYFTHLTLIKSNLPVPCLFVVYLVSGAGYLRGVRCLPPQPQLPSFRPRRQ